jgi:protease I
MPQPYKRPEMMNKPLSGKKVAVLVENKFIPEEIEAYRNGFAVLGAQVEFFSRIWYGDYKPGHPNWRPPIFYSDVDPSDNEPWQSPQKLDVPENNDISLLNLKDFAAVIMAANYISVRLRWEEVPEGQEPVDARAYVQSPPVVRFFAEAMQDTRIVKGALCHGLWILAPFPHLLKDRLVTCHTVVMADILNCGAKVVFDKNKDGRAQVARVVKDRDLVTGYSKHEVLPFIEAVSEQIQESIKRGGLK